jgi:hypothetical protein
MVLFIVLRGKQSNLFQSSFCERIAATNCITLAARDLELNLEASNVEALELWLQCIEKYQIAHSIALSLWSMVKVNTMI